MRLRAASALIAGELTGPVVVTVVSGRITRIQPSTGTEHVDHDLRVGTLTAGLLDLQLNGSFGVDAASADPAEWRTLLSGLASRGVTGVQPTVITASLPDLAHSLARVGQAQRELADELVSGILGAHLEGPFLSPARKGAHRLDCLLEPSAAHLDELLSDPAAREALRTVTLAPELEGAIEATRRLTAEGFIVSVGHSDATAAQVHAAGDAGATMTTHIFNAQGPLGHREPGVPGAVLADERFFIGTIIDGHHLDPRIVSVVMNAAGDRMVGVTDALVTAGLEPGQWRDFGGAPVTTDPSGLGRRRDGTIAGAGIVLDEGVRRMIGAGLPAAGVLAACTEHAARSLDRTDIGHVAEGALANLVWWDAAWQPSAVWIRGRAVRDLAGAAA